MDSNDYMKGDFSMTKMKKICIPVLAVAALAFSVPGTTQEVDNLSSAIKEEIPFNQI